MMPARKQTMTYAEYLAPEEKELASVGCSIDVDEVYRDPLAGAGAS